MRERLNDEQNWPKWINWCSLGFISSFSYSIQIFNVRVFFFLYLVRAFDSNAIEWKKKGTHTRLYTHSRHADWPIVSSKGKKWEYRRKKKMKKNCSSFKQSSKRSVPNEDNVLQSMVETWFDVAWNGFIRLPSRHMQAALKRKCTKTIGWMQYTVNVL